MTYGRCVTRKARHTLQPLRGKGLGDIFASPFDFFEPTIAINPFPR